MVDRLIDIKQKNLCLILLNYPSLGKIHYASTVNEHKHPYFFIDFSLF